jgi:hypothetical protein
MKRLKYICAAFGAIILVILIIWGKSLNQGLPSKNQPRPASADRHTPAVNPNQTPRNSRLATIDGKDAAKSATNIPSTPILLEEINDAAVMYDPAYLPAIQKYLLHPDQEVRKAAINGMIVLGHREASPMLREASKLAPSPHEAVAMLEAADYLELPSTSMIEDGKIKTTK